MRRGVLLLIAVAVVGAVALIGGLGGGGAGALDPVAQAADTTVAAGSAQFSMTGSVSANGQTIPINGGGTIDPKNLRADITLSTSIPGVGQTSFEEILAGQVFYLKLPAQLASKLPGGKPWMKIDLAALSKRAGINVAKLLQSSGGASNPADFVRYLKGAAHSHVVGQETINGVATTHYRATIDVAKAVSRIGDKQTAAALKQMLSATGVKTIPADVWVDGAGRMRRETINFSASGASVDMTVDLIRFGVPVNASPPADDQVFDASSLLGQSG